MMSYGVKLSCIETRESVPKDENAKRKQVQIKGRVPAHRHA